MNEQLSPSKSNVTHGVIRWFIRETMEPIMYIPFLFWTAGTWNWPMAWALTGLTTLRIIGTAIVTIPRCPELLAERVGPRQGSKGWDITILSVIWVLMLAMLILAGLDIRFEWTTQLPLGVEMAGMVAVLTGYGLVVWATGTNAYFSRYVRIQSERGPTNLCGIRPILE